MTLNNKIAFVVIVGLNYYLFCTVIHCYITTQVIKVYPKNNRYEFSRYHIGWKYLLSVLDWCVPLLHVLNGYESICITDYPKIYCLLSPRFLLKRFYVKRNVKLINAIIHWKESHEIVKMTFQILKLSLGKFLCSKFIIISTSLLIDHS